MQEYSPERSSVSTLWEAEWLRLRSPQLWWLPPDTGSVQFTGPWPLTLHSKAMWSPSTRTAWTHMYCIFMSVSVSSCSTLPFLIQRWPTMSTILLLFKAQVRYVLEPSLWTEVTMVPAEKPQEQVS